MEEIEAWPIETLLEVENGASVVHAVVETIKQNSSHNVRVADYNNGNGIALLQFINSPGYQDYGMILRGDVGVGQDLHISLVEDVNGIKDLGGLNKAPTVSSGFSGEDDYKPFGDGSNKTSKAARWWLVVLKDALFVLSTNPEREVMCTLMHIGRIAVSTNAMDAEQHGQNGWGFVGGKSSASSREAFNTYRSSGYMNGKIRWCDGVWDTPVFDTPTVCNPMHKREYHIMPPLNLHSGKESSYRIQYGITKYVRYKYDAQPLTVYSPVGGGEVGWLSCTTNKQGDTDIVIPFPLGLAVV